MITRKFIEKEHLPETYFTDANKYFVPLLKLIITKASESDTPLVVGVSGAQGTGKTSLSELLNEMLAIEGFNVARFSIDDFYLTRKERARLAERYHPLLRTRGVPGTQLFSFFKIKNICLYFRILPNKSIYFILNFFYFNTRNRRIVREVKSQTVARI